MKRKIIVENLGLSTPALGTDVEVDAAGGLWVHGLWRKGYLRY
jgi:hypothetical protein